MADLTLYCSFCAKSSAEIFQMIRGPAVQICDECIDLCAEIIAEKRAARDRRAGGEREYDSWFATGSREKPGEASDG